MRMVDLIEKKRNAQALSKEEITYIINGYTNGAIPDYQMSAFAMAIFFQDMTEEERTNFTLAMVESGETIDLSAIEGIKVDKHSTGGVGDTTTLVLAPLVAAVGVPVAKMSGRGLGHTGGTIDKLESVPGFHVEIDKQDFIRLVNKNKIAVMGQSGNLTPADKKLYGLRDVTATVNSIPLIASSIMSKKIAAGADAIVLDVKTGAGAFMTEVEQAEALANAMVKIGKNTGRNTMAVISDMSQPLGFAIGNALEIKEAINTLCSKGPKDLEELCLTLGSFLVLLAKKANTKEQARHMLIDAMKSGKAIDVFKTFLKAQGGDASVVDEPSKLPAASYQIPYQAKSGGYVAEIKANVVGTAAMLLGAGRATKDAEIDHAVGIELHKKIGDFVKAGETLATLHSNQEHVDDVLKKLDVAYTLIAEAVEPAPLIYREIC